jgi:hypothetical protein
MSYLSIKFRVKHSVSLVDIRIKYSFNIGQRMLTGRNNSSFNGFVDSFGGVAFDPDLVVIQGVYSDELSAYRAKKVWIEALESHFLLENESDYLLAVSRQKEEDRDANFHLRCKFTSACARYAFWRITNGQAPEAEYVLETAHIPVSANSWLGFDTTTNSEDLNLDESPLMADHKSRQLKLNNRWFDKFEELLDKIVTSFDTEKNKK